MSATLVLDASASVRAVLDAAAQPILLERIGSAAVVLAPTLLCAEVGNAFWKYCRAGVINAADLPDRHEEAMSLVHRFIADDSLFPEALVLAAESDHPVYDALYAITARRHAAVLLTFDRRLHALCAQARIGSELLGAG